ncbi:MAG: hypothetical protein JWR15_2840 [Prosthecobacter sp.]|nr:hypothetical protein [Prosthecobacter sp.]
MRSSKGCLPNHTIVRDAPFGLVGRQIPAIRAATDAVIGVHPDAGGGPSHASRPLRLFVFNAPGFA